MEGAEVGELDRLKRAPDQQVAERRFLVRRRVVGRRFLLSEKQGISDPSLPQ